MTYPCLFSLLLLVSLSGSFNHSLPCVILSDFPLPHLLPLILRQTLVDAIHRDNIQCKCFRPKLCDGTKADRKDETKDEELTNRVACLIFGMGRYKTGGNESCHIELLIIDLLSWGKGGFYDYHPSGIWRTSSCEGKGRTSKAFVKLHAPILFFLGGFVSRGSSSLIFYLERTLFTWRVWTV